MADDFLDQLKERVEGWVEDLKDQLDRLNPATETGEKPLSTRVERFKERVEDRGEETRSLVLSRLNENLSQYGVILKDDLDSIEERLDRIEAELREL